MDIEGLAKPVRVKQEKPGKANFLRNVSLTIWRIVPPTLSMLVLNLLII